MPRFQWPYTRFNGATTMSSWKGKTEEEIKRLKELLQWGHDDVVVERQIERGPASGLTGRLQWGHDDGVVEGRS